MTLETRRVKTRAKRAPKTAARAGRVRALLVRIAGWFAIGLAVFYTLACFSLLYLRWFRPLTTGVQVERRVQAVLGRKPYQKHFEWVQLGSISPSLQHAAVAAEDARFYQHHGIDWTEVGKVAEESLEEGEVVRGGSTITQQLIKNLYLTTARSPIRKAAEFALVAPTELILPKNRILELYLNVIEWGPGVYGAEAAARYYYHTSADRLTREQAVRLAAIIPSPRRRKPARMNDYAAKIETRMEQMGW
jgi:monofunctional glycosyltransferase